MLEFAAQLPPPYSFTRNNNIVIERQLWGKKGDWYENYNLNSGACSLEFSQTQMNSSKIDTLSNIPHNKKITNDEMLEALYVVSTKMLKNSAPIDADIQAVINKEFWNLF